ncbi:MAG: hypothetical protein HeimC2_25020 [Candidatus Heimdallarchaeota archaeon LC_2]|nr:MAG: hypothetical protein HeimC2_25020 [Candidatus Heimdallarchaeota archaeon LC_2]
MVKSNTTSKKQVEDKNQGYQKVVSKENIPNVSNVLIVGDSETSLLLSYNLQNVARFSRIIHVRNPSDALTMLMIDNFSVAIIDHDTNTLDTINLSRIIKINQPLCRTISITQNPNKKLIFDLINFGFIDSYMKLPIDDFSAQSIILEQQARYEINQTLQQFIINPPKFSPAYYLKAEPTFSKISDIQFELVGLVISYETLTRYVYFRRDYLSTDEILLSGYLSAITILGKTLFSTSSIDSIDFGGVSALFHSHRNLHFAFFLEKLSKSNYSLAEQFLEELAREIEFEFSEILISGEMLEIEHSRKIKKSIENLISHISNIRGGKITSQKPMVLSFGIQYLNISVMLNSLSSKFEIHHFDIESDAYEFLYRNNVDVVLVSPIITQKSSNLGFAARVLEISPKIQIIGINYRYSITQLVKILNSGVIGYVISPRIPLADFSDLIEKTYESVHTIDLDSNLGVKQRVLMSYEPHIQKSLLRKDQLTYNRMRKPELFGIFIARDSFPYYSKYFYDESVSESFDDLLFAGFISSLDTFSKEMFESTEPYSGIILGNASLITFNYFDFSFAFFTGNIDELNYPFVKKHLSEIVHYLFDLISNADLEDPFAYDVYVPNKIEQALVELFMVFSSLSFN